MEKIILIVDDSSLDRNLLSKALSKKGGFKMIEAENAESCLDILKQNKVDLILMDIMMPDTQGTQLLKKIREQSNAIELPVIMVTSKSETSDVVDCLQAGANDYLTKPLNFDIALSRIGIHLKLAELSKEMSQLKEMAALDALITTYNHEINNPLAIAIGCMSMPNFKEEATIEKIKNALWRIADIVKKIREISEKKRVEFGTYAGTSKLIKLDK